MATYYGWANYQTWNVALWIGGDETFYNLARGLAKNGDGYLGFASVMLNDFGTPETPDGVEWDGPWLDYGALDELMRSLP